MTASSHPRPKKEWASTATAKKRHKYTARHCRYCKLLFYPQQKGQKFCTSNHQKAYWKYGSLPMEKMELRLLAKVEQAVTEHLLPILARLQTLERNASLQAPRPQDIEMVYELREMQKQMGQRLPDASIR